MGYMIAGSVFLITLMTLMIRSMAKADGCCGNCINYRDCYHKHPEYNKQNTQEHPVCKNYRV